MKNKQVSQNGLTRRELLKYGLYGGLASCMLPGLLMGGCGRESRPNIILITLDTTRADHLSCYGYHRQTSPNLDQLAATSVLYTRAIAPSSWTLPSHASLFTGKFTSSHGARNDPEGPLYLTDAISGPKEWQAFRARGLAQSELTLAAILREAGYSTGAFIGGPYLKKIFGLQKGFDYYDDKEISSLNGRLARQITESALKWVDKIQDNNFFLFLNYFDPHGPYMPPEGFAEAFLPKGLGLHRGERTAEEVVALYDSEILYMDHYIGKLFQELKKSNLYEKSMIIVTADHGELLGEHGKNGHGKYLYQEELHIPLIIKYPGTEIAPRQSDDQIQLNDIMAIILERLAIPMPLDVQAGVPPQVGHPILAEVYPIPVSSPDGDWRAIFKDDFKFIWNSKGNHQLFNLKNDPHETKNLLTVDSERKKRMMSGLDKYLVNLPKPGPVSAAQELNESTKKALKSLGYVE